MLSCVIRMLINFGRVRSSHADFYGDDRKNYSSSHSHSKWTTEKTCGKRKNKNNGNKLYMVMWILKLKRKKNYTSCWPCVRQLKFCNYFNFPIPRALSRSIFVFMTKLISFDWSNVGILHLTIRFCLRN